MGKDWRKLFLLEEGQMKSKGRYSRIQEHRQILCEEKGTNKREAFFLKEETPFSVMIGRSNHRKNKQNLRWLG